MFFFIKQILRESSCLGKNIHLDCHINFAFFLQSLHKLRLVSCWVCAHFYHFIGDVSRETYYILCLTE